MKTRAAYQKAPWQTKLRSVTLPKPPAREVLLRVAACGICGTDLSAAVKTKNWQPFGHEVAGVIETLGAGIDHLRVGQTVVLETSSYCGRCELCRNGRVDLCNKAPGFWGRPAMGLSDRMLVPVECVVPYSGLAPDIASLAEPAGVAYDMVQTAAVRLGERVAVIGPGPIALMAIPLLRRAGAARVVCIGHKHSVRRLEVARQLGAEIGHDLQAPQLARQFDHVLVTAPVETLPAALALLAYGGELTYIGIGTGPGKIAFEANDFHYRKLQLRASFASPALYFPVVLDLLKAGIIPGEKIISHHFALRDIGTALQTCRDEKATTVKVIVNP